ncbi:hypothetical protein CB1_000741005 [Camelus ferus]|nr:hypothetical protein CB1_000741005 [Camelus ferus]
MASRGGGRLRCCHRAGFQWVHGGVCKVQLTVYNPMPFELRVENMATTPRSSVSSVTVLDHLPGIKLSSCTWRSSLLCPDRGSAPLCPGLYTHLLQPSSGGETSTNMSVPLYSRETHHLLVKLENTRVEPLEELEVTSEILISNG